MYSSRVLVCCVVGYQRSGRPRCPEDAGVDILLQHYTVSEPIRPWFESPRKPQVPYSYDCFDYFKLIHRNKVKILVYQINKM
jgi:hypothetical protein